MRPTSNAHPLSPPLGSATLNPFDLVSDLTDSASAPSAGRPLFPPSPPPVQDGHDPSMTRRTSVNDQSAIGLGFPSMNAEASGDVRDHEQPLRISPPSHLSFPRPPHLLPEPTLAALPLAHLLALANSLSRDLALAQTELAAQRRELEAIEKLALDKGTSAGEIERAKVRVRATSLDVTSSETGPEAKGKGKDWRIELGRAEEHKSVEENARVEVDLDLEDLTEAISSNAFDIATSPVLDQDEARLRNPALSLPAAEPREKVKATPHTNSTDSQAAQSVSVSEPTSCPSTLKPARGRHASLSSRFFGSIGSASMLVYPSESSSSVEPQSPIDETSAANASLLPVNSKRNGRSGSIRSVSSVRSTSSKASDAGSDASRKGGYNDWFGWKGWSGTTKSTASLKPGIPPTDVPEEGGDEIVDDECDANRGDESEGLATPMPDQSGTMLFESGTGIEASTTMTKIIDAEESSRQVQHRPSASPTRSISSRRTSATRSTVASTFDDSTATSLFSTLSPPPTMTPNGKASTPPGMTPPDSPATSRNRSPAPPPLATRQAIANPALSTPLTTSVLSTPSIASPRRSRPTDSPENSQTSLSTHTPDENRDVFTVAPLSQDTDRNNSSDDQSTLKRRTNRTESAPPTFVPGVPLYTATGDGTTTRQAETGYVAAAKGTIGRALGLGFSGEPSNAASIGMTRSSSDGIRRALNGSRSGSLSLSQYSPFSQHGSSAASTPMTLSSTNSPTVVHATTFAPAPPSGLPTTMELGTISVEVAPPSLALLKPATAGQSTEQAEAASDTEDDDGPLIDRYGFIYDVACGMALLKETRRRDKEKDSSKSSDRGQRRNPPKKTKEEIASVGETAAVTVEPSGSATPTQLEVHPQLEAIREAMGLTPTIEAQNTLSPRVEQPSIGFEAVATPLTDPPALPREPPKLIRSPDSDDSSLSKLSGPQSMRALLGQLRNMSDNVERTQQGEWDAFIRKRQTKLGKLKQQQYASVGDGSATVKGKGKLKKKERPKTIWGANALAEEKPDDADGTREEGWTENLVGVAQMGTEGKGKKEDWNYFKELVRKGIPISYRPKIWGECSSANEAREPGLYQELLFSPREDEQQCLKQIDMDCHRTFPTNVFFAGNGPGVAKLRNVLVAYSRRNPNIGYCQGMNNLVATLLLTHPAEEDAFWVLVCIVENILPSDYYTSHLLVSRADQQVLNDLVSRLLPTISAHLEEHGVELSAISFGWFLSLFTDVLPIQTLLRVWDLFFIHGTVLLFRVALSILKLHEAELLACDSAAGLYGLLGSLPGHIFHADKLLKVACEDLASSVKDREVAALRRTHVLALQEELGIAPDDA
ncbi:uncharacterized protein JCM15063_001226 [Sporobolomyces koalae]|uniref:uncharacterized protein n=1 Tax=Sporobolomyces koalae TaxID=500713 RepID=UPI00316F5F7C